MNALPLVSMGIGAAVFVGVLAAMRGASPAVTDPRPPTEQAPPPGPYRRALAAAGLEDRRAQSTFAAIHAASVIGGACLGLWLAGGSEATFVPAATIAFLGAWLGWWMPRSWLHAKRTERRIEMVTEFPVALDLLQIALEGGMGLAAAWAAVAASLSGSRGGLAQEMRRIEVEVGFGTPWSASLASATARTGLPEFGALGSLLDQTERFGTEMAQMIRVMSDSLRHEEVQALEERAHRVSVLILIPLSGLLLPGSLILMFAPPFVMLMEGMNRATP